MVDCGNPRCAQERRSFRRDLQSCSKKLPMIIGLERIAADYVDKETAKKLLSPYPDWEKEACSDYRPCTRCFHCEKRLPNIYKRIRRIIDETRKGKESSGRICLRSLQDLMPFSLDFYTQGFGRELFSDAVKNYFLAAVHYPLDGRGENGKVSLGPPSVSVSGVTPVSAVTSASSSRIQSEADDRSKLKVPYLSGHTVPARPPKKHDQGKTGYSEEDLELAVSDIQSGRLGTRRAAMIYGIPRSTLRSKVIKPEPSDASVQEEEAELQSHHVMQVDPYQPPVLPVSGDPRFNFMSGPHFGLEESFMPSPSSFPFPSLMPYPVSIKMDQEEQDYLADFRLSQIRRLHNLNGLSETRPRPAHANHLKIPLLSDVVRKLVHQRFMEIKANHRQKAASESDLDERPESDYFNSFGPYLPGFSPLVARNTVTENHTLPMYNHIMESIYTNMMNENTLAPKLFGKVNESSRIGDTLKDIIAKTLSEKMRFHDTSSDENSLPATPDVYNQISSSHLSMSDCQQVDTSTAQTQSSKEVRTIEDCSPPKRAKKSCSKSSSSPAVPKTPPSDNGSPPVKKTRPKRGQYRKYNSQLLMDAVRAVQRGEMSVHRAGSFYGVPHSTLEYKVKERHLLRQKKPRDGQSPSMSKSDGSAGPSGSDQKQDSESMDISTSTSKGMLNSSSSTRSSTSCSSSPSTPVILNCKKSSPSSAPKPVASSSPCSPPLPASSSALSLSLGKEPANSSAWFQAYLSTPAAEPAMGFIPPNLSLNNSASELLRKLQHKVQAKSSPFTANSAFDLPNCGKKSPFEMAQGNGSKHTMSKRFILYNQ